jgi:ribosomal protein L37AE/L43A
MSFVKYATAEILEVKTSKTKIPFEYGAEPGSTFQKFAALEDTGDEDGYLYIRTRSISSRVNKNNDGWPSEELAKGYKTFVGRPLFVDHNNDDPKRTRGVILDARLFVDEDKTSALDPYYASAPASHLPPTHIETISEVDAKTFPKLAEAIRTGKIDSVSMGANIESSICSVCENKAATPKEYCNHIKNSKGNEFEVTSADGSVAKRKAYEDCYGVNFFEQSFVFDPADETALFAEKPSQDKLKFAKEAAEHHKHKKHRKCRHCGNYMTPLALYPHHWGCSNCGHCEHDDGTPAPSMTPMADAGAGVAPTAKVAAGLKTDVNQPGDEDANDKVKNRFPDGDKPSTKKPQSESVTAPERVDTLSNDLVCPNCESDNLQEDPDQIWRCPTCEYELPPEEFRAPDLQKAREMDVKQKVDSEQNEEGEQETKTDESGQSNEVEFEDDKKQKKTSPVAPVSPLSKTINNNNSNRIISDMDWTTKPENVEFVANYLNTVEGDIEDENAVAQSLIDSYGKQRLAKANITRLEIAEGIEQFMKKNSYIEKEAKTGSFEMVGSGLHAGSAGILNGLGWTGTLTYHGLPEGFADQIMSLPEQNRKGIEASGTEFTATIAPGTNAMMCQSVGMTIAKSQGGDSVQVTLDAPDEYWEQMRNCLQTKGVGPEWSGAEDLVQSGDREGAQQSALQITSATIQPSPVVKRTVITPKPVVKKDERIINDQLKPVEASAGEEDDMEVKFADRRVIKREEKDEESGVTRSEQIVEETGEIGSLDKKEDEETKAEGQEDTSAEETSETPRAEESEETEEKEESRPWEREKEHAYASVQDETKKESKLLLCMQVAKLASTLGVISAKEELNYAAELESKSEDVIRDRKEVFEHLKSTSALQKSARYEAVPRVPRLGGSSANGHNEDSKQDVVEFLEEIYY